LVEALQEACVRILTNASGASVSERLAQISATLPGVAAELLDDTGMAAFQDIVALGHRPLPGET